MGADQEKSLGCMIVGLVLAIFLVLILFGAMDERPPTAVSCREQPSVELPATPTAVSDKTALQ
jgi:hypothetical protein